ncbi:hypothetical protein TREMEDRAFT_62957 [Tremella mesenterica DSM 1558]|uniref:uncharacterized protein n=1 Tax=Tremella mesenterica (strain ATCC 24925 / CBS 8224 / DSM 1558 / NBRC 9311 / NRRL Y-6157 / RJB 2259-6 / UBC 559-6) TaxID=578456 RepID=UPI0003F4931F|nr:uncharacterized protein TREMEDRAFT_62957 [Tremella mesenterica DSM 1558]EIW69225.1 hypothetical protein TREMEDRAFT_62957 [Tremella mesenterica DSM 1558]
MSGQDGSNPLSYRERQRALLAIQMSNSASTTGQAGRAIPPGPPEGHTLTANSRRWGYVTNQNTQVGDYSETESEEGRMAVPLMLDNPAASRETVPLVFDDGTLNTTPNSPRYGMVRPDPETSTRASIQAYETYQPELERIRNATQTQTPSLLTSSSAAIQQVSSRTARTPSRTHRIVPAPLYLPSTSQTVESSLPFRDEDGDSPTLGPYLPTSLRSRGDPPEGFTNTLNSTTLPTASMPEPGWSRQEEDQDSPTLGHIQTPFSRQQYTSNFSQQMGNISPSTPSTVVLRSPYTGTYPSNVRESVQTLFEGEPLVGEDSRRASNVTIIEDGDEDEEHVVQPTFSPTLGQPHSGIRFGIPGGLTTGDGSRRYVNVVRKKHKLSLLL